MLGANNCCEQEPYAYGLPTHLLEKAKKICLKPSLLCSPQWIVGTLTIGCSNTCSRDGQYLGPTSLFFFFLYSLRQIKSRCLSASPIWSCNADYLVCLNKDLAHTHCTILVAALKHLRNQYYVVVVFLLLSKDLPHRCSRTMLFPLWLNISSRRKRPNTLCGFHYLIEQGVNRNEGTSFF